MVGSGKATGSEKSSAGMNRTLSYSRQCRRAFFAGRESAARRDGPHRDRDADRDNREHYGNDHAALGGQPGCRGEEQHDLDAYPPWIGPPAARPWRDAHAPDDGGGEPQRTANAIRAASPELAFGPTIATTARS